MNWSDKEQGSWTLEMMITTRRDNVNVTLRTTTIGGEDTNDPFCGRPEIWASIVSIVLLPGQLECLIYTVVYTVIYTVVYTVIYTVIYTVSSSLLECQRASHLHCGRSCDVTLEKHYWTSIVSVKEDL